MRKKSQPNERKEEEEGREVGLDFRGQKVIFEKVIHLNVFFTILKEQVFEF